ncbi:DUF2242 domain-containing protein [Zoogloea sp.]|jgi:hypothetical protein|uniref:DUF2242 domain-containing protein n=1 Tax=Zoogloea sp. TaxID=49181 RepID=UPI0035B40DF9
MRYRSVLPVALASLLLAACGTFSKPKDKDAAYRLEHFTPNSPYEQSFDEVKPASACEAGRRALLSQGYVIEEHKPDAVRAKKFFQPERGAQVQINFTLSCLVEGDGASVFANARQVREELKAGSSSAGLSVAGIGSVSLPFGASNESLVKVGEETITDAEFYGRFFALMQSFIR